jgi:hypothetical protein
MESARLAHNKQTGPLRLAFAISKAARFARIPSVKPFTIYDLRFTSVSESRRPGSGGSMWERPTTEFSLLSPRRRGAIWAFGLLFLFVAAWAAWGASVTAAVDRTMVPVGESITLSLTFEGANPNSPPPLPPIPNFRTSGSTGYRSEMIFDGTRNSMKYTFQYGLLATQVGEVTIPSIQVPVAGQVLVSQPIRLRVISSSDAAAAQTAAVSNLAFVRLIVPKTDVYVGEPFVVEIHLYWQNAKDIRIPQLRAEGFALSQLPEPAQSRTRVGNGVYNLAVFRLSARAAQTGMLTLGPAEESLFVFTRQNFFGQPLDGGPVNIASESVPMRVSPLPTEGVPEGFNGAMGSYRLAVDAGPTSLAVGDPVTVRVKISGTGALDALTYPTQAEWRDFNVYPPTSKLEAADPLGLSGTRNFEQVVIPQNHEIKSLPPFKFSFFDPQAKQYRTLSGPNIPLTIRPGSGSSGPVPVLTNLTAHAQPQEVDIIHIRPHLELGAAPTPWITHPWFLGIQAVPVMLWLGIYLRRRQNESLANNPRLRRRREVAVRIRDGLKELRSHSAAGSSNEFFALLFRLLQEQVGERLDLPSSAITESIVDERLGGRGLPEETLKAIRDLFQACNLARYAPVRDSQELAAWVPKLESVLRDLQSVQA